MTGVLLTAALSRPALGAPIRTVEVGGMDGDLTDWDGPVSADTAVTRSGGRSLRWAPADGGSIRLAKPMPEAVM